MTGTFMYRMLSEIVRYRSLRRRPYLAAMLRRIRRVLDHPLGGEWGNASTLRIYIPPVSGVRPHPAGGARRGPRKLLAVITRGMADAALKASSRGNEETEAEGWRGLAKLGRGKKEEEGGHRELPWYLHGIKDPPIALF